MVTAYKDDVDNLNFQVGAQCFINENYSTYRSSHRGYSVKKDFLNNFANFTGKHLCQSLFLTRLQAFRHVTLIKRDSNAGAFL